MGKTLSWLSFLLCQSGPFQLSRWFSMEISVHTFPSVDRIVLSNKLLLDCSQIIFSLLWRWLCFLVPQIISSKLHFATVMKMWFIACHPILLLFLLLELKIYQRDTKTIYQNCTSSKNSDSGLNQICLQQESKLVQQYFNARESILAKNNLYISYRAIDNKN